MKTLLVGLACLQGVASAQIAAVFDLTNTKPGKYFYSIEYRPDGSIVIKPVPQVIAVGSEGPSPGPAPVPQPYFPPQPTPQPQPYYPPIPVPAPQPQPQPQPPYVPPVPPPAPVPTPQPQPQPPANGDQVEQRVQQLTQKAMDGGATITAMVCLQRVYYIVGSGISTNLYPTEKVFEALKTGTDIALQQNKEEAKWAAWRASMGGILSDLQASGKLGTKEEIVAALNHIGNGIRNTINSVSVADPTAPDKINYNTILAVQQQVLKDLKALK